MVKTNQLVIEVHYVPLPAAEMDERRERLRALLLRGAFRFIQQPLLPEKLPTTESVSASSAQE
jgi:hypothetical protein